MSKKCEDCGCTLEGSYCTNCHEEAFIMDTAVESFNYNPEFVSKADEQREQIKEKLKETT